MMVLISHLDHSEGSFIQHFSSLGNFGVRIFFVISGFLITKLILQEKEQEGRFSLSRFYFRRTLRIVPALLFYLIIIAILSSLGLVQLLPYDLISSLTYTVNYHQHRSWYVAHLWSLSVEEQFYVLWPLIVGLLSRRRAEFVVLVVVIVSPILRLAASIFLTNAPLTEWFPTTCDALAVGCLLALKLGRSQPTFLAACSKPWFGLVPLLAVVINSLQYHVGPQLVILFVTLGQTTLNCCIALSIGWLITFPYSFPGRMLDWRPLTILGALSYSLYIWQQPFLSHETTSTVTSSPLNIVLAAAMAVFSYNLVEKPTLAIRNRFSKRGIESSSPSSLSMIESL